MSDAVSDVRPHRPRAAPQRADPADTVLTLLTALSAPGREGLLDLRLLALLVRCWQTQPPDATHDPTTTWVLPDLARSIYGRDGGQERRMITASLQRLRDADLSEDETTGNGVRRVRRARLLDELEIQYSGRRRAARSLARVTPGSWLSMALHTGQLAFLQHPAADRLSGLPLRVWMTLEAALYQPDQLDERLAPPLALGARTRAAWSLRYDRPRDERRALARAGQRVLDADARYRSIELTAALGCSCAITAYRRRRQVAEQLALSFQTMERDG